MTENFWDDVEVVSSYSRAQAIEDGVLVDVTETAKEAGIKFPVALSQGVWTRIVVPSEAAQEEGQSIEGRLWDVLWLFRCYAKAKETSGDTMIYPISVSGIPEALKAVIGPGDTMDPVITIMLPWED